MTLFNIITPVLIVKVGKKKAEEKRRAEREREREKTNRQRG